MKSLGATISTHFLIFALCFPFISCSQQVDSTLYTNDNDTATIDSVYYNSIYDPAYYKKFDNTWVNLEDGLDYIEMDGPRKSKIGDSKISLLRINPEKFKFEMLSASQFDSTSKCIVDWAEHHDLMVAINASMYDMRRQLSSKAYMRNTLEYANNPKPYEGYNMAIAFNPLRKGLSEFDIIDLKCTSLETVKKDYASIAQGLRMIDCNGTPMSWNKNPQWCSQLIVAKDDYQQIYFVFTRSPYSQNEMIRFMTQLERPLRNAIYMEGGPQTSLYVDTETERIEKLGSYVSNTYPITTNAEFWKLPNVIGIKRK
ncbi:MAG TPA: phosphodiester glycosidase family protein [Taishania sp.]|nr:phosphodiester glycosidase family protein [Taishania sp.]